MPRWRICACLMSSVISFAFDGETCVFNESMISDRVSGHMTLVTFLFLFLYIKKGASRCTSGRGSPKSGILIHSTPHVLRATCTVSRHLDNEIIA